MFRQKNSISAFSVSCTALTTVCIQLLYLQNSAKRKSAEQYRCQSRTYSFHNGKFCSVYIFNLLIFNKVYNKKNLLIAEIEIFIIKRILIKFLSI